MSSGSDHDRPLSNTGEADAVKVSHKLRLLGWIPELILSRFVSLNTVNRMFLIF